MKPEMEKKVLRNYQVSTWEGMFSNLALGMVNPFLGIFAVALGASNIVVGLITSLPALVNVLMMIPAAQFSDRYKEKLPLVFWGALAARFFYLPIAFVPFLTDFKGESFVLLLTVMTIPAVILNINWTSLMSNVFPVRYRGELFGRRNMWCGAVSMLATVVAGMLLDIIPYPYNWSVLFGTAFVGSMVSTFIIRQHQDEPGPVKLRRPYWTQLTEMLKEVGDGPNLKVFLGTSFLFHLGINFSAPLWAIYFGRELQLSNSLIGGFTTIMGLTTVLASPYWGRKVSLYGDSLIFTLSMLGMGLWPAIFALSASPTYMLLLHAVLGIFVAAFNLTIFNMLLSAGSYQYKSAAIATFHTLNSLTGFVAPFLGAWSLRYISIQQAFGLATILRLSGLILFAVGTWDTLYPLLQQIPKRLKRRRRRKAKRPYLSA